MLRISTGDPFWFLIFNSGCELNRRRWRRDMVSKCANPDCSAPFRYFHTGKLFRADTAFGFDRRRPMGRDAQQRKAPRRLGVFWLCEDCSGKMTLAFDSESGVTVRPNECARSAAAA